MHASRTEIEKIKDWGCNQWVRGAGIRKAELGLGTAQGALGLKWDKLNRSDLSEPDRFRAPYI